MTTRRERVVLELEDHFTSPMAKATAATVALDKALHDLDKSAAHTSTTTRTTESNMGGLARSADKSSTSINQLTGRLRLMADVAAILGPSLVPISAVAVPAVTGLASQFGFAAIGAGSLVLAMGGIGDAMKAVNAAKLDPTVENLEKAEKALAKIGPDAEKFVAKMQELRPVLADIRMAAAAGWLPGLTDALDSLEEIAPRVATLMERIGEAGGILAADGAEALAGPEWERFMLFVQDNAPQALDELGRSVGNIIRGLAELWMAFDPLNDDFSASLLDASRAFAEWSANLSSTDGFQEFVEYIRTNGPRVGETLVAVANAALQIVEALAPLGGPSLKIIEVFADAIAAIADSDLGTPILAGVAALSLYNRALAVTASLQAKVAASGGPGGKGSAITGAAPVALGGLALNSLAAETGSRFEIADVNVLQSSPINAMNALIQRDADKFILSDVIKRAFTGPDAEEGITQLSGTLTRSPALLEAMSGFADAAGQTELATEALKSFAREYQNVAAVLSKQGSFDAYKASIDSMTDSVERNGKTLSANTAAGRENRANLNGIAESAIKYSETLIGTERIDFLKKARARFVEGAKLAGGLDKRAREVLATLDALAGKNPKVKITLEADGVAAKIAAINAQIRSVPRQWRTDFYVNQVNAISRPRGPQPADGGTIPFDGIGTRRSAEGSTVPSDGGPYSDRFPYLLAPGEEVISNRFGQADQNRALLKAINSGRQLSSASSMRPASTGGAVSTSAGWSNDPALLREVRELRAAVNRGTAVNAGEHHADRKNARAGAGVAARSAPRGYVQ